MSSVINSKRIEKICQFVDFRQVLEIGCDHAYITKTLFTQKKIDKGFLSDISLKCLEKAKKNLSEYHDKTQFSVRNGFKGIKNDVSFQKPQKTQKIQVIIAGMGGQEIIKILKQEESKLFKHFILQPQKNIYELRKFLLENNYKITCDEVIKEDKFFYFVLKVESQNEEEKFEQTTKKITCSPIEACEQELLFGKISKSEDYKNYITYELSRKREIAKTKKILKNEKLIGILENILKDI